MFFRTLPKHMHLSFLVSDGGNRDIMSLDIDLEMSYAQFLATVAPLLRLKKNVDYDVTVDGKTYKKAEIVAAGSLKTLNLKENDLVIVCPDVPLQLQEVSENERLNLIRSIHVPRNAMGLRNEVSTARDGDALYRELKKAHDEQRLRGFQRHMDRTYPGLFTQFERRPNDRWAFLIAYRNALKTDEANKRRRGHLAMQELMEKKAEEERLNSNFVDAMHETPEAMIPVEMLYIKIKLNGVEGHAFIDTGAAKSLISRDYVDRCGLSNLVNAEHAVQFRGIGGTQASEGTIWMCDMTIESHELPVTLHVVPNGAAAHEVLLGLDLLLRHRAMINLMERTLTLNNEVTTKFLNPAEASAYMEREREELASRLAAAGLTAEAEQLKKDEPMETDQK